MMISVKSTVRDQRGIASILSVVFFILIASVVMVGFMRLALLEGRQSLEDSLSKAALAAAYSGVNDAKRALLYCSQFAARPAVCDNLNNDKCPGFFGDINPDTFHNELGLSQVAGTDNIQVGDPILNERYTCVIVTEDTYTVEGTLIPGSSEATTLIPLRGTGNFNKVVISWHSDTLTSTIAGLDYDGDSVSASYRDADSFSTYFRANPNWPALIGAHLMVQGQGQPISYNADGSVAGLDQRRWLLYPYVGATGRDDVSVADATRQLVRCTENGRELKSGGGSYHCQIEITGLDALLGTRYLQLTGLYNKSDYVVELMQDNTSVRFDNVSPQVDSTGAVENVFRRVQVGLRYEGEGFGGRNPILPNAIDTGAGLCKNFAVGGSSLEFSETCGF